MVYLHPHVHRKNTCEVVKKNTVKKNKCIESQKRKLSTNQVFIE